MGDGGEFTRYQEPVHTEGEPEPARDPGLTEIVPGLVRLGAVAWWRGTQWSVETSVRVGSRVIRYAASGQAPADLLRESGTDLRAWLRRFLDVVDESASAAASAGPFGGAGDARDPGNTPPAAGANGSVPLRERGAELLRRSADVDHDDEEHPAYERIREMPPADFSEMLRSAMREDEWLLYLHGAVLGFAGGLAHLAVFG